MYCITVCEPAFLTTDAATASQISQVVPGLRLPFPTMDTRKERKRRARIELLKALTEQVKTAAATLARVFEDSQNSSNERITSAPRIKPRVPNPERQRRYEGLDNRRPKSLILRLHMPRMIKEEPA